MSHVVFCSLSSFFFSVSSCLSTFLCFDMSHVAFQERRVRRRVPISSVALPQAAIAPLLAELRCDWLHNDSLTHLPVKRLSQFMLPENGDLTVYQKDKVLLHFSRNLKKTIEMHATCSLWQLVYVLSQTYHMGCFLIYILRSPFFVFFAIYFFSRSHIRLSEHIIFVCSLMSHSCLSWIH